MSKASIERYTLLIDHNRKWLASLACSSDIGGDTALRRRLVEHLDMSLKCLERHRDYLIADLAKQPPVPAPLSRINFRENPRTQ